MENQGIAKLLRRINPVRHHRANPRVVKRKVLKFPERFGSIHHARQFMESFVTWYNYEHCHTGIGLHTPADVHFGLAASKAAERSLVLADARRTHPERFSDSGRGPKILDLPTEAWINKPATIDGAEPAADQVAA